MREQESKYETDSFMKVSTDVRFMKIYERSGIKKFGEKVVDSMVK